MKKVFVEPRIKRIELNLNENIANSSGREPAYIVWSGQECHIYNTKFTLGDVDAGLVTPEQLGNCVIYVDGNANTKMTSYVTRKQLFGY